ncbi:hypothetical protein O3P69_002298 [Scylla paramamosain]|uniref:Uncharacterized protein n=1 Tax=Scylla paramamosain TaxID=85552 RepID=A0AAW0V7K4_SCYPA
MCTPATVTSAPSQATSPSRVPAPSTGGPAPAAVECLGELVRFPAATGALPVGHGVWRQEARPASTQRGGCPRGGKLPGSGCGHVGVRAGRAARTLAGLRTGCGPRAGECMHPTPMRGGDAGETGQAEGVKVVLQRATRLEECCSRHKALVMCFLTRGCVLGPGSRVTPRQILPTRVHKPREVSWTCGGDAIRHQTRRGR